MPASYTLSILPLLFSFAAVGEVTQPMLYRVSCEKSASDSYLLGTIHVGIDLDEFDKSDVKKKISGAREVLVEVERSDDFLEKMKTDPWTTAMPELKRFAATPGDAVDQTTINNLVKLGIPADIAGQLSDRHACIPVLGFWSQVHDGHLMLDGQITEFAHQNKIPVESLDTESLREQAKALDVNFQCSLKDVFSKNSPEQLRRIYDARNIMSADDYRRGIKPANSDTPLAVVRNLAWMSKLLPELKKGGVFAAVGSAHLFGNNGLLSLIARNGCSVRPVFGRPKSASRPLDPLNGPRPPAAQ